MSNIIYNRNNAIYLLIPFEYLRTFKSPAVQFYYKNNFNFQNILVQQWLCQHDK